MSSHLGWSFLLQLLTGFENEKSEFELKSTKVYGSSFDGYGKFISNLVTK